MIRLGAPVFLKNTKAAGAAESHGAVSDDPDELVQAHKAKGYTAAYAPKLKLNETDKIKAFRKAFEDADIVIAEVGFWENLLHTDPDKRKEYRDEMIESLALAEELGACCAVDILGSYCNTGGHMKHDTGNFSQDAFDEAVEIARYLIDTVKPKRTSFAYEIFPFNIVDSPEMIDKLIKAVDRPKFGVHMDLVNLINCPRLYWTSGDIIRRCIKLFGDRIVSAHAKDISMQEPAISVILEEVLPGRGGLDIAANIRELHKLPQVVPYMIEHLDSEDEYDLAAAHIRKKAMDEGITL